MATFSGSYFPSQIQGPVPGGKAGSIGARPSPQPRERDLEHAHLVHGVQFTDRVPVTLVSDRDRNAVISRSFFETYYDKVYAIPTAIDFGAISTLAQRSVILWNAHLTPVTLDSIVLDNAEGIFLDGAAVPVVFGPLQTRTYVFTATDSGPATLSAVAHFSFDPAENLDLPINGQRARVNPLTPNWRQPVNYEYEFKTDIVTSRNGKEQRRALRQTPRRKMSYQATPTRTALRKFNDLMAAWHNNTIVLPEFTRQRRLSAPAEVGAALVNYGPAARPNWMVPGATVVMVWKDQTEARRITAVVDGQVQFSGGSSFEWPVGSKIHPSLAGRFSSAMNSKRETNQVGVVSLVLEVTPGSESPLVVVPPAPYAFNGRELFMEKPNWGSNPDVNYEAQRDVIDYGRGRTTIFLPIDYRTRLWRASYIGRDQASGQRLVNLFLRAKGQRGEFYMPTWEPDIEVGYPALPGSQSLRVYGTAFADDYKDDTVHKAVFVMFRDGTYQCNVVQNIYKVNDGDGNDSIVQVADDWVQEVSPLTAKMVCWLPVWRFATDLFQIQWDTNTVARCDLTMRTLEDLPV